MGDITLIKAHRFLNKPNKTLQNGLQPHLIRCNANLDADTPNQSLTLKGGCRPFENFESVRKKSFWWKPVVSFLQFTWVYFSISMEQHLSVSREGCLCWYLCSSILCPIWFSCKSWEKTKHFTFLGFRHRSHLTTKVHFFCHQKWNAWVVLLYGISVRCKNTHLFCEIAQMTVAIPCSGMDLRMADFFITVNIDTTSTSQGLKERRKSVCIMDALKLIVRSLQPHMSSVNILPTTYMVNQRGTGGRWGWVLVGWVERCFRD